MRIAVFGSGGVGGYFGGRLAQAGEEVYFIARGDHLQAMQDKGLRVDSIEGDFVIQAAQSLADPHEVGPVEVVLVAVKAWQVPEAAEAIKPLLGPQTVVVPLQNGVEAPTQLAAVLGPEAVVAGLCGLVSFVAEPGLIKHTGISPFIKFGELDNRRSERIEQLYQTFKQAKGLTVEIPADIQVAMWQKFLLIVAWSGVGSITRAPLGILRTMPETRHMLKRVMQEVVTVAQAHQVNLPADILEQTMSFFDKAPPTNTTSMQRDILAGRPSELDSQMGAIVRLGRAGKVPTPLNNFIYHALLPLERQARGIKI